MLSNDAKFGSGDVWKKAACSGEAALTPRSRKAGGVALTPVLEVVLRVLVGGLECRDHHAPGLAAPCNPQGSFLNVQEPERLPQEP